MWNQSLTEFLIHISDIVLGVGDMNMNVISCRDLNFPTRNLNFAKENST